MTARDGNYAPDAAPGAPESRGTRGTAARQPLDEEPLQLQTDAPVGRQRVASLTGEHVAASLSAVGRLRAGEAALERSAAGAVIGRDVRLTQGAAGVVVGARVSVDRCAGQWVGGGVVRARQLFAVTVIAGKIEGQVRCLFDARSAFAFGAGAALATSLLRLLLLRRR